MSEAKLKYNPAHDAYEVTIGEFSTSDTIDLEDDGVGVLPDDTDPMIVALSHCVLAGLKPNTVYRLEEVPTELEADGEIDLDDEEDEDDGEPELN